MSEERPKPPRARARASSSEAKPVNGAEPLARRVRPTARAAGELAAARRVSARAAGASEAEAGDHDDRDEAPVVAMPIAPIEPAARPAQARRGPAKPRARASAAVLDEGLRALGDEPHDAQPVPEHAHAHDEHVDSPLDAPVRDLERDLAGLLSDVDGAGGDAEARRRAADAIGRIAARLNPDSTLPPPSDESLIGGARQLLSTDYVLRQLGRLSMRGRSEQVDDFGLDPTYQQRIQPVLDALYERYFRVQVEGAEHVPSEGAAMLVCNHSGALPFDGLMLKTALRHAHPAQRALRWLTDDFIFHSPFLGTWLNRIGAVRACPENAERLLERGEVLAVFPEGVKGISKSYSERYQLQRFGRGGHVKLALRARVPVLPVAIVGGEETYPMLYRVRAFAKTLGLPYIPVTPLFPWLGPLGLLPLPSRWRIVIGPPLLEIDALDAYAAEDNVVVNDLNEQLRASVQALVQQALRARGPNAFF